MERSSRTRWLFLRLLDGDLPNSVDDSMAEFSLRYRFGRLESWAEDMPSMRARRRIDLTIIAIVLLKGKRCSRVVYERVAKDTYVEAKWR